MDKFWAVWRKTGGSAPNKRHTTRNEAITEAQRLCQQTGEEYFVLEVIGAVYVKKAPTEFRII